MKRLHFLLLVGLMTILSLSAAPKSKSYRVVSPDRKIEVVVSDGEALTWQLFVKGDSLRETVLAPSVIAFNSPQLAPSTTIKKIARTKIDAIIKADIPCKASEIHDECNQLTLILTNGLNVVFRVYNNGVAYRYETALSEEVTVSSESLDLNFPDDNTAWWTMDWMNDPKTNREFMSHYEGLFQPRCLSEVKEGETAFLPLYMQTANGTSILFTESDLFDYSNMFLQKGADSTLLKGVFPPLPLETAMVGDRSERYVERADYVVKTEGTRTFPWRIVAIGPDDKGILENNLVYQLASPAVEGDKSWIKPGHVAWDWWNALNIFGVDFASGVNTDTYKYYIDFASANDIEYIILDEGWSKNPLNIREPRRELDLKALIAYGQEKEVGIILWCLWNPLMENVEGILDLYASWGVKGIKVDFMQRADQKMVNFHTHVAKAAFDRHLLVDFHGCYKPTGLNRTYPNVINYEGVRGSENNKWEELITPTHDLTLPFTRMVAGPLDYTPGAVRNEYPDTFKPNYYNPGSQGTRAHQTAMYVLYDSPLQMLCDNPSNYMLEPAYPAYLAKIPTVWDETIVLEAKIGEYVVLARRRNDRWYLSAMTDWTPRSFDIPLTFTGAPIKRMTPVYEAEIFRDNVNTSKRPTDYRIETKQVQYGDTLHIEMARGGGWTAIITPTGFAE